MKIVQPCGVLLALLLMLSADPLSGQEQEFFSWSSEHYQVLTTTNVTGSREIARKLEAALVLFNEFLHYDLSSLKTRLRVRIFAEKEAYDAHLERLIAETRSDFVFISYNDPNRSELVGFQREKPEFDASLLHYGFIQFLSAFVPTAPLWIEEGLATYLEYSQYDPVTDNYRWQADFAWLDSLKKILKSTRAEDRMSLPELLLISKKGAQERIEIFYPTAWGLVHFLLQSPEKRYNRIFWEALDALEAQSTLQENSRRVMDRAFGWVDPTELESDFSSFILSLMTFNDLVRQGVEQYGKDQLSEALANFQRALERRSDNYIPYYYLGLLAYRQKEYETAQSYYRQAAELGIDSGLINYALGVNAFADQRYELAAKYLEKAKEMDLDAYTEKVDALMQRIQVMR